MTPSLPLGLLGSPLAPVERIALGGLFGDEPVEDSYERLDFFRAAGGRILDTAHSYGNGSNQRVLGTWLRSRRCRDDFTVVSKVCHPGPDGLPRVRPEVIRAELTESLRRLGCTHLDVLLLHRDDRRVPVVELVGALEEHVAAGEIRAFGVSNWTAPRLAEFLIATRSSGTAVAMSYQFSLAIPRYEIWEGALHADAEVLGLARDYAAPLLAWSAQARGWFAGGPTGLGGPFDTEANRHARHLCNRLAGERGVSASAIALAWTLHQPIVVLPVVGPSSVAELGQSLAAASIVLSPKELTFLSGYGLSP